MDHFNLRDGTLHCEDVALPVIAEAVGTPVYVYSTATMQRHARVFRAAVGGSDPLIAFAVKANPNAAVLATLAAYWAASRLPGLAIQGVAVHIGSQLTDLAPLDRAFEKVGALIGDLRAAGHDIRLADLGGGLGVPYDRDMPLPPSPEQYGAM